MQHVARGKALFCLFVELMGFSVPETMQMQQPRDGRRHLRCVFLSPGDGSVIWVAFCVAMSDIYKPRPGSALLLLVCCSLAADNYIYLGG